MCERERERERESCIPVSDLSSKTSVSERKKSIFFFIFHLAFSIMNGDYKKHMQETPVCSKTQSSQSVDSQNSQHVFASNAPCGR